MRKSLRLRRRHNHTKPSGALVACRTNPLSVPVFYRPATEAGLEREAMTTIHLPTPGMTYVLRYDRASFNKAIKRVFGLYLMGKIEARECVQLERFMLMQHEAVCEGK